MNTLPDFKTMTEDEIAKWIHENDLTELMKSTERITEPMTYVGPPAVQGDNLERASFRIEPETLEWLAKAAGRDREGKSGIVRRALAEFRERHPDIAA